MQYARPDIYPLTCFTPPWIILFVMIIDGETYACEACVRGHRVRDCQHHGEHICGSGSCHGASTRTFHQDLDPVHIPSLTFESKTDRPLQTVNKKGRPVSQCQHCRAMRKARSAHVKCGCGKWTPNRMKQKESIEGDKGDKGELAIGQPSWRSSNSYLPYRGLLLQLWWTLHLRLQERTTTSGRGF